MIRCNNLEEIKIKLHNKHRLELYLKGHWIASVTPHGWLSIDVRQEANSHEYLFRIIYHNKTEMSIRADIVEYGCEVDKW